MKRNVRLFSMILALLCVVSMIPVMTVSAEDFVAEDGTTYKVVRSVDDLHSFVKDKVLTENIIFGADIDYTGKSHVQFDLNGKTIDGNGYAMCGLSFTSGGGDSAIFLSAITDGATIRNLTIGLPDKPMTFKRTGKGSLGVLIGYTKYDASIENVTIYANITTGSDASNGFNVGAFVGNIADAEVNIKGCKFYGTMEDKGSNNSGAFVGNVQGSANVTIENCINYGTISNVAGNTGGFVGQVAGTADLTIKNSANVGDVSGTGSNVGGLVGSLESNSADSVLFVQNCLNTGSITGSVKAAGMVCWKGYNPSILTLENSVNMGSVHCSGTDTNAKNNGAAGLVYKFSDYVSLDNCGSFATVTAANGKVGAIKVLYYATTGASYTNLYYSEISGSQDSGDLTSKFPNGKKSLAEGIAWTNALLGETVGKLIVNNAGNGAVLAAPTFAGVQEATNTAGKIRFVATLNDSLNYSAVGFKVTLVGGQTVTTSCQEVYNTLTATDGDGLPAKVTAEDLYGTYIFALAIKNIPQSGTVKLQVTPYGKDLNDPTIEYAGDTYEIVYTDGKVVDVYLYTA